MHRDARAVARKAILVAFLPALAFPVIVVVVAFVRLVFGFLFALFRFLVLGRRIRFRLVAGAGAGVVARDKADRMQRFERRHEHVATRAVECEEGVQVLDVVWVDRAIVVERVAA